MFTGEDAHVTNIAVDPAWHRHKIGTGAPAPGPGSVARGARHLTLEVRVSNDRRPAMYRRFGFVGAGVRKNYYAETNEDALVMWADDIDTDGLRRPPRGHGRSRPTIVRVERDDGRRDRGRSDASR